MFAEARLIKLARDAEAREERRGRALHGYEGPAKRLAKLAGPLKQSAQFGERYVADDLALAVAALAGAAAFRSPGHAVRYDARR